jgi:hypothetical protein
MNKEKKDILLHKKKNAKVELPYDPVILLLGICPRNARQNTTEMAVHLHCSSIHNSQALEITPVPTTDEWIKKIWNICTISISRP